MDPADDFGSRSEEVLVCMCFQQFFGFMDNSLFQISVNMVEFCVGHSLKPSSMLGCGLPSFYLWKRRIAGVTGCAQSDVI